MVTITVFTPVHAASAPYLQEAYESLCAQTVQDWKWHVLENNGGVVPDDIKSDPRISVLHYDLETPCIGALKRVLCESVKTEWALELDADDVLHPDAIQKVLDAIGASPDASFIYSDFAEFRDEGEMWQPAIPYGAHFGWEHYTVELANGTSVFAMRAPPVTPQNLRLVDWAPNHARAFKMSDYNAVGGHNTQMAVADDHDLIVRMYLNGCKFAHISECLYFYRLHKENTVGTRNAEIRQATNEVYNRNIWALAEKFADDNALLKVDLCSHKNCPEGYLGLDKVGGGAVQRADLDGTWPLADSSVGVLRARDAIEHLRSPIHTMNEAFRVLAPGGFFMVDVPSTNGPGAWCDPTHVSFWNHLSFRYYSDKSFAAYIPEFNGKFHVARVIEWFPNEWHRQNNLVYCEVQMICQKEPYRHYGANGWL